MSVRALAFVVLLMPGLGHASAIQDLASSQIEKLNMVCKPIPSLPLKDLTELKGMETPEDWRAYMAFDAQVKWTEFAHEPACKTAMLENAVEGMAFFLKNEPLTSNWINMARGSEAQALLILAVSSNPSMKSERLAQADALIAEYVANEAHAKDPKNIARGMGYYFPAHWYLTAAKAAAEPADVDTLLARALQTARAGMEKATDKSELMEPYGIALGEIAKRAPKGSPEWRKAIEESIDAFATNRATDPLAPYNIAIDRILLGDLPAAHKELQDLADAGRMDDQICMGMMTDPDLTPLRDAEMPWFRQLVIDRCQPTIQRFRSRAAHP
ncbi:hypothetical protein [Luteibacter sp. dw_328]|uniref:hypothetical protein n=1 Tax=Luteibacter sp. dw_328 TaxID=2719796 RepID=UPI001BD461E6|nr:hypothetical protein [Luteibacter sp. dw_328]